MFIILPNTDNLHHHQMRGMKLSEAEFEYMLGKSGAIDTIIKDDPKPKVGRYYKIRISRFILFSPLGERLHDELLGLWR